MHGCDAMMKQLDGLNDCLDRISCDRDENKSSKTIAIDIVLLATIVIMYTEVVS